MDGSSELRPRIDRMPSLVALTFCLGSLVTAALLRAPQPGAEGLTLAGFSLPPICALKRQYGIPCPGCGLTRSWVSVAHGDFAASLGFHRLGWLVMAYVGLQAMRNACWLLLPAVRGQVARSSPYLDKAIIPLGILVLLNWILQMAGV